MHRPPPALQLHRPVQLDLHKQRGDQRQLVEHGVILWLGDELGGSGGDIEQERE